MKRVLIVDNETDIRNLLIKTFDTGHNNIFQAENGKQAIEIARAQKPDLIIMDIVMPGTIDGFEATRILKNDPETQGCAIILLTGYGCEGDRVKSLDFGANGYFEKPFSPLELLAKMEELIGL